MEHVESSILGNEEENLRSLLLTAIPHPAMIIKASNREIIAYNKFAEKYGAVKGGKCWHEFCKSEYVNNNTNGNVLNLNDKLPKEILKQCSFCLGDKCTKVNPLQVVPGITIQDKVWDVYWVKLDDDILLHYTYDITENKLTDKYKEMSREILQILNEPDDSNLSIHQILSVLKSKTEFDAVGIRLIAGEDYPYYAQTGFTDDFLLKENSLVERNANGDVCRDENGKISLECTCGLILSGNDNSNDPLFTPGGSIWTNDSLPFLDIPRDQDVRYNPRNTCIHHGYSSVALIPLKNKDRIVGLLQFNDKRKNRFTIDTIELLELIASYISGALMRKQIEITIRESEEKHRLILKTAMDGFWIFNLNGKLLEVNDAYCQMSGYSLKELLSFRISDLDINEEKVCFDQYINNVIEEKNARFETKHRKKDGSIIYIEVSVQYQSIDNGQMVCFLRDVTENKIAEALRLEHWRLESIIEGAQVGTWEWNIRTGEMIYNDKWCQILGYTQEELAKLYSKPWETFTHSDDQKQSLKLLGKHLIGEIPYYECEYRMKHKDGHWVWVLDHGRIITRTKDGHPLLMFGTHTDITNRKQAEVALVEKERLSAIGELASGVAHDFNNSLQAIIGNVELALMSPNLPADTTEYLNSILTTIIDATARVKQVQRFSRKESDSSYKPVDYTKLIEETIEQTRPKWKDSTEKKGLRINFLKEYGPRKYINGNIGELRSAFYNIINNAIEAMPNGGTISIKTAVEVDSVSITISDTGIGMTDEVAKRIFQPFFTTKGYDLGRGLGLSAVYSTIRDHHGNIYVKSTTPGKGTTFELVFPITKEILTEITETETKDNIEISLKEKSIAKILWVDDSEAIRNLGKNLLSKLGHQIDLADGGQAALDLLDKNHYDLLITDVGMPGMSGWQLAKMIKGKYNMKVAIITGWGSDISEEEKAQFGVSHVISKPVGIKQLKELVDKTLYDQLTPKISVSG